MRGLVNVMGFFAIVVLMAPAQTIAKFFKIFDPLALRLKSHRMIARLMKMKVRVVGKMSDKKPTIFVANHSSYLDVSALGSVIPASFVAKSDVADWPLIGRLARVQDTAFIERKSTRALDQKNSLGSLIEQNKSIIFFPEGTSSNGLTVLPFKSSLFSLAEKRLPNGEAITVQPVTIVCTGICGKKMTKDLMPHYAWYGDMTLVPHLWTAFKLGEFELEIVFHKPVSIDNFANRKELSKHCQSEIETGMSKYLKIAP